MKTKRTNNFIMLILSVVMIVTLCVGLAVFASAAETDTPKAEIIGQQVNLGGDISMKYHVQINDESVTPNNLRLIVTFLGKQTELTEYTEISGAYVFNFEGIIPQCMGDDIDAVLYVDDTEVDSLLDYSVKENLENTYKDTSDEKLKSLILDTLKYGAASQVYKNYKTDALVTAGELAEAIATDTDVKTNPAVGYLYTGSNDSIRLADEGVTVNFGSVNTLKFKYVAPEGSKVTIDGEEVTPVKEGDYWVVETKAIAAADLFQYYTLNIADTVTVKYSATYYCYSICVAESFGTTYPKEMIDLASALYNYTHSAHVYDGTKHVPSQRETCVSQAVCVYCTLTYGDVLPHNYTYTANANTITESCDKGCGHSVTVTLNAPADLVYNGEAKVATLSGTDGLVAAVPTITYSGDCTNVGQHSASITLGDKTASVAFTITSATASISEKPTANKLTYNGTAQALVSGGTANGGSLVYSLTENGEFTSTIPTATNADTYTVYYKVSGDSNHNDSAVASIEVIIAQALPDYASPDLTATYGQTLGDLNLFNGSLIITPGKWTWDDAPDTLVGDVGENLFNVTFTPNDDNYQTIHTTAKVTVSALTIDSERETLEVTGLDEMTYTGSEISLENLVIKDGDKTLVEGEDYTITYEDNEYVGTAKVIIEFIGNYDGTVEKTFEIKKVTDSFDGIWLPIKPT